MRPLGVLAQEFCGERTERSHCVINFLRPRMPKVHTNEVRVAPLCREYGPWCYADVMLQRHVVEAQGIDSRWKLNPQHIAAFGTREAAAFRKIALQRLPHLIQMQREAVAKAAQMTLKSSILEILGDRCLWQRCSCERGHKLQLLNRMLEAARCGPADAVAGSKTLGEGAAVEDKALPIAKPSPAADGKHQNITLRRHHPR